MEQPVSYLVANDSLPWQLLANSRWFRLNYQAVAEFDAPYVTNAPYTIWRYQPPPPDLGPAHALNARVPDRLRIRGYQVNQENLESENEAVITLYLEAPPATTVPPSHFTAKIRLDSPLDASTVAEWDVVLPTSIDPETWQAGETISEQIAVDLPPGLEPGAYPLKLSLADLDAPDSWAISLDNDSRRLDRIQIGHVTIPVEFDQSLIQAQEALLNNEIKLLGFTSSNPQRGEGLELTLFWQAEKPLDNNYVVFTHVLDSNGQLVVNHDSVPDNGRYPTPSWIPGMAISDSHLIQLPPDLAPGDYQIRVGLYVPESGERLPITAADGSTVPDNSFPLTQFSIP